MSEWLTLDEWDAVMDDFRLAVAGLLLEVERYQERVEEWRQRNEFV